MDKYITLPNAIPTCEELHALWEENKVLKQEILMLKSKYGLEEGHELIASYDININVVKIIAICVALIIASILAYGAYYCG